MRICSLINLWFHVNCWQSMECYDMESTYNYNEFVKGTKFFEKLEHSVACSLEQTYSLHCKGYVGVQFRGTGLQTSQVCQGIS